MWPGSAPTALLFVGLPLLMALVLMAAPLDDGPPPTRDQAALMGGPRLADAPVDESAPAPAIPSRKAAVPRPRPAEMDPVPAVIFETRRTIPQYGARGRDTLNVSSAPSPASATPQHLRRPPMPDPASLAAVVARANVRARGVSEPQPP